MRYLILLFFVSSFSHAVCIIPKEKFAVWNEQYAHLFEVVIEQQKDGAHSIYVSLPDAIEEMPLDLVAVALGGFDEPNFFSLVEPFEYQGKTTVWFVTKLHDQETHALTVSYGDGDCGGISVQVPIEFN
ncbi:hypothetical protein SAMN06297229_1523 [Pseudidiomarina planktonica]|uniref:Uncharacterized protein n=1 Tax=Pseudidiomarina planktonica TaxID=1323738 RepID=A0A1Y6EW46_9GAMM|nr:hypothetical protein [Pseudidiomarina planktonica]RUO65113.1 hypothetical protein CWI77_01160 [Pseudidiomarina planktonica]SMQ66439.1 hypothetical protein SAMN06297229_1523 [Pseudidiomarina planktonica]